MIKNFDKNTCIMVSGKLQPLIDKLAKELGVSITLGRGTYTDSSFTLKVEFCTIVKGDNVMTTEAKTFQMFAPMLGFKPSDLFRTFPYHGTTYKIIGALPRSRNSILAERADGKIWKISLEVVKMQLGKKEVK